MAGWILAIDVGTTSTAAARRVGDRVETIQLEGGPRMPSLVFWREGTGASSTGRLVLGVEAEELSTLAPWCLERAPKSRLGEEFIQLGDKQLRPVEIIGAILREVHNEAMALSGGEAPSEIRLTHPARWQKSRLDKLAQAAKMAGLSDPIFVPEPVAAAVHFASARLAEGEHVAVYDLGGGTLDTAVLKRGQGTFEVVGRTGGDEELGGEDFDDLLYRHLGDQLPGEIWQRLRGADASKDRVWAQANRGLLRHARQAKEGLSRNPEYEFYLPPPIDQELVANVADFEALVAPTLRGTVAELERTILAAGLQTSDLAAVYLAGGSSRIPLVGRLIQERLGTAPEHLDDPKAVIALGAARLDRAAAQQSMVEGRPLEPGGAPIPPLPVPGGGDAPPPTEPPPDRTEPVGPDPDATEIVTPKPKDPGAPAAPSPVGPVPPQSNESPGGPGDGDGGGGSRRRTIAGVAVVAVVVIVAAVVLATGGSGGDSTTSLNLTSSSTSTSTSTSTETTTTGSDATSEDALKQFIAGKYRNRCQPEPEKTFEQGAVTGLNCDGPSGYSIAIESFQDRSDLDAAFEVYADVLPHTGSSCSDSWNLRSFWGTTSKSPTLGKLACFTDKDGYDRIVWTGNSNLAIGFLGSDVTNASHAATFKAWQAVAVSGN